MISLRLNSRLGRLSFGGRITLAKSVLGSIPSYYLSLFPAPVGILDTLEKIRKNFVWCCVNDSKKIHWVAWSKITSPKDCGGIGLGSIRASNLSLLSKWAWRLKTEAGSLWAKVIEGIHGLRNKHWSIFSHRVRGGVWRNIDQSCIGLKNLNILPADVINWNESSNSWISDFVIDGRFMVNLIRSRVERASHPVNDGPFIWSNKIPLKIAAFVWRARQGKIPSAVALKHRGVNLVSTLCVNCIGREESVDHLLVSCPMADLILESIFNWCEIPKAQFNKVADLLIFISKWSRCSRKRSLLASISYCSFWCIWKGRNQRIFNNYHSKPAIIVENVQSMSFIWWKHRGKIPSLDWKVWLLNPFLCL